MDLFSPAGIAAWRLRLNSSSRFADAARAWHGRLLLVEQSGDADHRMAWVVVAGGACVEARVGTPADESPAEFILAAPDAVWLDLIAARSTPATAALRGQLILRKGNALALLPHAHAAAELLAAAAEGVA